MSCSPTLVRLLHVDADPTLPCEPYGSSTPLTSRNSSTHHRIVCLDGQCALPPIASIHRVGQRTLGSELRSSVAPLRSESLQKHTVGLAGPLPSPSTLARQGPREPWLKLPGSAISVLHHGFRAPRRRRTHTKHHRVPYDVRAARARAVCAAEQVSWWLGRASDRSAARETRIASRSRYRTFAHVPACACRRITGPGR